MGFAADRHCWLSPVKVLGRDRLADMESPVVKNGDVRITKKSSCLGREALCDRKLLGCGESYCLSAAKFLY